jgi:hypothetical protein
MPELFALKVRIVDWRWRWMATVDGAIWIRAWGRCTQLRKRRAKWLAIAHR